MKEKYEVGKEVIGMVTGITKYGIFLTFKDGYAGLIHISQLSEHFVHDVSKYASVGEKIPCVVTEIDTQAKQLKCSIKNTKYGEERDRNIDHGFSLLRKQLPIWMDEKLKEYAGIRDENQKK